MRERSNSSKSAIIFQSKDKELDIDHGGDEEEEEDEDDYNICNSWMIQLYSVARDGGVFVVVGWLDLNSTFGKAAAEDRALAAIETSSQEEPTWTKVSELTVSRHYVLIYHTEGLFGTYF